MNVAAFRNQSDKAGRVYVGYDDVRRYPVSVCRDHPFCNAVVFDDGGDGHVRKDFPAHFPDGSGKGFRHLETAALKPPAALYERAVHFAENIQRQVFRQFHLKGTAADNVLQPPVGYYGVKEVAGSFGEEGVRRVLPSGIEVVEYVARDIPVAGNHLADPLLFIWKIRGKPLLESLVTICKEIACVGKNYLFETVRIKPFPREVHQAEIPEEGMQAFSFADTAHIVEARVEGLSLPLE